jgi:hypothetical protein
VKMQFLPPYLKYAGFKSRYLTVDVINYRHSRTQRFYTPTSPLKVVLAESNASLAVRYRSHLVLASFIWLIQWFI